MATIAFYGPDDTRASKVAVAIIPAENVEPSALERWYSETGDVRTDLDIAEAIRSFIQEHQAKTVTMVDRIFGCPHEEGVDYPEGHVCPQCPFWEYRDRYTGEVIH